MRRKHLTIISVIATTAMLAWVVFLNQSAQSAELNVESEQDQQTFCSGLSNSVYFAEVKSRFSGIASAKALQASLRIPQRQQNLKKFSGVSAQGMSMSSPLWLLHRSLLI